MEDLLDLYAEPHDPKRPVVCFDESPIQLIGEVRVPIKPKPGKRYRYDSEYKRNGTANLFVMVDANRSWRKIEVTDRRANEDFAVCMRDLADVDYPDADKVRVVMDNPADDVGPASIATFVPKDRALSPAEIRIMLKQLEHVPTLPTIRLGLRLLLLTMVRKSELQDAVWDEVDFENALWSIPGRE